MRAKTALYASVAIGLLAAGYPASMNAQQPPAQQSAAVQIDGDDIGGVVASRFGPEAGVWVIAETTELGTRFAKMVVTDEVGRYVIPDLPKAKYRVWVRGYGLVDSPKVDAEPGKLLNLTAVDCTEPQGCCAILSGDLLGGDDQSPGPQQVPGHRAERQRHPDAVQDPRPVSQLHQDQRLRQLPPDRQLRDPHDSRRARQVRFVDRRLGAPPAVGAGRHHHDQQHLRGS